MGKSTWCRGVARSWTRECYEGAQSTYAADMWLSWNYFPEGRELKQRVVKRSGAGAVMVVGGYLVQGGRRGEVHRASITHSL